VAAVVGSTICRFGFPCWHRLPTPVGAMPARDVEGWQQLLPQTPAV